MIPEDDLKLGQLCLLKVDNRIIILTRTHLCMIITSTDVLHSWVVPSLGVKCDDVPRHLNQTSILLNKKEFTMVNAMKFVELIMRLCVHPNT